MMKLPPMTLSFPLITAERAMFRRLLRGRVADTFDIDGMLALEAELRGAVAGTVANGGPDYDVGELIDDTWSELQGVWRELRHQQAAGELGSISPGAVDDDPTAEPPEPHLR